MSDQPSLNAIGFVAAMSTYFYERWSLAEPDPLVECALRNAEQAGHLLGGQELSHAITKSLLIT